MATVSTATTGIGASGSSYLIKTRYLPDYELAGQSKVYWDQFAYVLEEASGMPGKTYSYPIGEWLNPSTGTLTELEDVVAQSFTSNEVEVTLYEYGGAVELTKFLAATALYDVYKMGAELLGYHMAESLDLVARAVCGQGGQRIFINSRTARSGIAGQSTSADRLSPEFLSKISTFAKKSRMPLYEDNAVACVIHPFVFYDIRQSSTFQNLAQWQYPDMLMNGEYGFHDGTRFVVADDAKVFAGAGAAATSTSNTTLSAATAAGATSITVASASNISVGTILSIGTAESDDTWYDTNEQFYVTAVSGTTITGFALEPGSGTSGGMRYAHASGATVTNHNCVYPLVFLGPQSIVKAYSNFTGPHGELVVTGPIDRLGRFLTFGWYGILGYNRPRTHWIWRAEVGSSMA